ncbi:MAG: 2-oxoacid:acceptor oxidoreductase subunit alpha [Candidatus Calescibacterium sp.]|nr:2-oxoacid:acceptor oxidoreductase subunit alpha [Candidatus Calescibacterium sp.]MDW8195407.1 2-oxoacid:acceptor oxidoreductase subunit alpha [Candidatus Calescibacterium sp.]
MKKINNLTWLIGGPQGMGVDSSAHTFAKTCASIGLYIFGKREYHSNIKGAHSYYPISVSDKPIRSHSDNIDILATFDKLTLELHKNNVVKGGIIILDKELSVELDSTKYVIVPIPFNEIIKEAALKFQKEKEYSKLQIMRNVITVAASLAVLNLDFEYLKRNLQAVFTGRRSKVLEINVFAAKLTFDYVHSNDYVSKSNYELRPIENNENLVLTSGTTATAIGKIVAGCRFQTYYPITPASDESEYLETHPEYGVLVVQTEDEIAAICMAIGASLAGVRSATSTSGPGLSLMTEAQGWAGMNEVPVVIFNYQRGGPSTGLPTRHEQGDLEFSLYGGHSEFPRIVISPGDIEESFYLSIEAFNLAEKYQVPVIFLSDKSIANSIQTVKIFDISKVKIERGKMLSNEELQDLLKTEGKYKRFKITEDGISPRIVLGQGAFWNTGDEHDEVGHICEESNNRTIMFEKRMKKIHTILKEVPDSLKYRLYGPGDAEYTIVSWGSAKGPILDSLEELNKYYKINFLQIILLKPFPANEIKQILSNSKMIIGIEANYSGQLCNLIRKETGINIHKRILKWNGRPFSREEIFKGVIDAINLDQERIICKAGI